MSKLNLEINKELVVSTCHVAEDTLSNNDHGEHGLFNYSNDECNRRFLVSHLQMITGEELDKIPASLYNLLKIAQDADCKWLVLDCDGPVYDNLPKFEW